MELLTTACSYDHWENQDLRITNNIFYLVEEQELLTVSAGDGVSVEEVTEANAALKTYFTEAGNEIKNPGFILDGLTFNLIPSNDVSENLGDYPGDPFFTPVNYKGAFDPNENWAAGWSLFSKYMN